MAVFELKSISGSQLVIHVMFVTIYCDTPCVRDLGALFGHLIKQPIFTYFDGLLHVETPR